jgi:TatA/E family protein of Tat protein translocase
MPFLNSFGPAELIIILVIALLVIGPGKLPEVGSALGKSIREFRKAATDVKEATSIEPAKSEEPAKAPEPARASVPAEAPPTVAAPSVAPSGDGPASTAPAEPVGAASGASDPDSPAS